MATQTTQLVLNLNVIQDVDLEEVVNATRQLQSEELLELDVLKEVDFVIIGETPTKAKAGDPITWGTLLLTLATSGGVLTTLINVLQAWLNRNERYSLKIKIGNDELEVTGISSEEKQRLIEAWLSRQKGFVVADE